MPRTSRMTVNTPPGVVAPHLLEFEQIMKREFKAWLATRPWHDDEQVLPLGHGSAPEGWTSVAHRKQNGHPTDVNAGQFLMKRHAGGWAIVQHTTLSSERSTRVAMTFCHLTLAALYEHLPSSTDVTWIEAHMISLYDPTDAAEAAHQTLGALGAPLRVLPRAAHLFG